VIAILVVDDDDQLRRVVNAELKQREYRVSAAGDVEGAMRCINDEGPFDVLLTDLRMVGRDGIDLIAHMQRVDERTRTILMSGYASARDYQSAMDYGAVRVLCKPFTPDELIAAIEHAVDCETGFRGSVHGLSLVDMLQMFHYARRTITLRIEGPSVRRIDLVEGEIVHAECGEAVGVEALGLLLATHSGTIRTVPRVEGGGPSISVPFEALLLDILREIDEAASEVGSANGPFESRWGWLEALVGVMPGAAHAVVEGGVVTTASGDGQTSAVALEIREAVRAADRLLGDPPTSVEILLAGVGMAVVVTPLAELVLWAPAVGKLGVHQFRATVRNVVAGFVGRQTRAESAR
jgi:CheY-like chemotaxis protein